MSKEIVRTLAFDPGLTCTGWAIVDVTLGRSRIDVIRYGEFTLTAEANKVYLADAKNAYGIRVVTLELLRQEVSRIIQEYQPNFVAAEEPFFQHGRPLAFAALTQWITVLATIAMSNGKKLHMVPNRAAKKLITGFGGSDKAGIQNSILANAEIVFRQRARVKTLGEHEGDSIAIAYYFIQEMLPVVMAENPDWKTAEPVMIPDRKRK